MATPAFTAARAPTSSAKPQLDKKPGLLTIVIFFTVLAIGLLFTAYSLMHGHDGTSGVDRAQATKIGYALLLSPLVGFGFAALLLLPCGFSSRIARCTRPRWATLRHRHPNYLTTT